MSPAGDREVKQQNPAGISRPAGFLFYGASALLLLVLGILADHHDLAFALDNLALFADRLDRRPDFHEDSSFDSSDQLLLRQVIRPRVRS